MNLDGCNSNSESEFDKLGYKINKTKFSHFKSINKKKNIIIEKLIRFDKEYRPPLSYKPQKLNRVIHISRELRLSKKKLYMLLGFESSLKKKIEQETNTIILFKYYQTFHNYDITNSYNERYIGDSFIIIQGDDLTKVLKKYSR